MCCERTIALASEGTVAMRTLVLIFKGTSGLSRFVSKSRMGSNFFCVDVHLYDKAFSCKRSSRSYLFFGPLSIIKSP